MARTPRKSAKPAASDKPAPASPKGGPLLSELDSARLKLVAAGEAAAAAQLALNGLPADASAEDREEAQLLLEGAGRAAAAAEAEVTRLLTPGAPTIEERRAAMTADLTARLNGELERLAAEKGISREEIVAFALEFLGAAKSPDAPPERNLEGRAGNAAGPAAAPGELVTITVIGPLKGRRRAGFSFNATPQTIEVTAAELALVEADADLAVSRGALAPLAAGAPKLGLEAFRNADGSIMPVKVLGPKKGRRRAGFQFGAEAQVVTPDAEQLAQILADADLAVMPAG